MKRLLLVPVTTALLFAATAQAQTTSYGGMHPVNPDVGGGFCSVNTAHNHPYGVDANISYLYRVVDGQYHFVGDPYLFGYEGQAFPYYGHHPLTALYGGSYCYLDGAHYHAFFPPSFAAGSFLVQNGYYYYRGLFPSAYYTYRSSYYRRYHSYWHLPRYNVYYQRYRTHYRSYARPAVMSYIRNPPRIVYRVRRPVTRVTTTRISTPVYRYRPSAHQSYRGIPATQVRTYNTRYRPPPRSTVYRTSRVATGNRPVRTTTTVRRSGWRR